MDEQAVQDLILCMREFGCFPFDPALPILRTLQSAPPELIHDFQTAREDGGGGGGGGVAELGMFHLHYWHGVA